MSAWAKSSLPSVVWCTKKAQFCFGLLSGGSAKPAEQKERKARVAAFMGLRIMSEQAAQLAKQGSVIPHLYPERQLSRLTKTPHPLGVYSVKHVQSTT